MPDVRLVALTVVALAGCVSAPVVQEAPPIHDQPVPTRTLGNPGPQPEARILADPADVEAFVRRYGACSVGDNPDVVLQIAFDPTSGFVGYKSSVSRTRAAGTALDEAMHRCNVEMGFIVSTTPSPSPTRTPLASSRKGSSRRPAGGSSSATGRC